MRILALSLAVLAGPEAVAAGAPVPAFPEVVRAIQSADYRGARADLQRLAAIPVDSSDPELAAYQHYWRGFALWRRALNGFNETPTPLDLQDDLKAGIASFQAALDLKPGWIEAQIGIWGCSGPLVFLAKEDKPRLEAILKEYTPVVSPLIRTVIDKGADNPRALWVLGQSQLGGAGGASPDPVKAATSFHRGVDAALAEASQLRGDEPAWVPRWGGAENLMNLSYLYTHSNLARRDLALAYAEGALVAAPDWHFVRDILRPKILEMTTR